jgi:hypothetical protein
MGANRDGDLVPTDATIVTLPIDLRPGLPLIYTRTAWRFVHMQIGETDSKEQNSPQTVTAHRLPYRSPALVEYGQVSKLTQGGGFTQVDGINTTMMACI